MLQHLKFDSRTSWALYNQDVIYNSGHEQRIHQIANSSMLLYTVATSDQCTLMVTLVILDHRGYKKLLLFSVPTESSAVWISSLNITTYIENVVHDHEYHGIKKCTPLMEIY